MFSPWYGDALRGVLELEEADVVQLERKLAAAPDDFPSRLKVMAYYQRADRARFAGDRLRRVNHTFWLVTHHPESELLHSYVSRFAQGELVSAEYQRAVVLWEKAAGARSGNASVQWNAATFFESLDEGLHLHYLEKTVAADPNHPFAIRPLAHLYALSILNRNSLALRAHAGLEGSKNVWVLGNAAYMFQSQYNHSVQMGAPNAGAAQFADRYFLRAKALDPNLDRQKVLPQIDVPALNRAHEIALKSQQDLAQRADSDVSKIRRLAVEAFPDLPSAVAGVLRARKCSVPQPLHEGAPQNVIRGEFFQKGESGWAVFCSSGHSTTLLVFRNASDTQPAAITTGEDRTYLDWSDKRDVIYSRRITAVNRDFVMRHYRAYGGPEPPPIDHHGIDDAFLDKASVTWYFHRGKWLQLRGAD
ncbi:MAG: hypothetical protein H7039_11335 [Bryobacteraceae bacterium]|nr:hypothetical protein [Bryobacteraceae bacterium]